MTGRNGALTSPRALNRLHTITESNLVLPPPVPDSLRSLVQSVKLEAERNAIAAALEKTGWNRKAAARLLKISYRTLLYKIEQYQIRSSDLSLVSGGTGPKVRGRVPRKHPDRLIRDWESELGTSSSPTGVVMKNRTDHQIGLGFVLIVLTGSLWAQVPDAPGSRRRDFARSNQPRSRTTPALSSGMTTSWRSMFGKNRISPAQFRCAQTEEFRCPWWESYRRRDGLRCSSNRTSPANCGTT